VRFKVPAAAELKEEANRQAQSVEKQEWWWRRDRDPIFFAFAKGEKGRAAAQIFLTNCRFQGIPCWPGS
jgi:hypothetical protein